MCLVHVCKAHLKMSSTVRNYRYSKHYWPMDVVSRASTPDIVGRWTAVYRKGAQMITTGARRNVGYTGREGYIDLGNARKRCYSDPELCKYGFTAMFWLKVKPRDLRSSKPKYIISTGAQSRYARGFALWYNNGVYTAKVSTATSTWTTSLRMEPTSQWFHVTIGWRRDVGLYLFINGAKVSSRRRGLRDNRKRDTYTRITVGRPNNNQASRTWTRLLIDDIALFDYFLLEEDVYSVLFGTPRVPSRPFIPMPRPLPAPPPVIIQPGGRVTVIGHYKGAQHFWPFNFAPGRKSRDIVGNVKAV